MQTLQVIVILAIFLAGVALMMTKKDASDFSTSMYGNFNRSSSRSSIYIK